MSKQNVKARVGKRPEGSVVLSRHSNVVDVYSAGGKPQLLERHEFPTVRRAKQYMALHA